MNASLRRTLLATLVALAPAPVVAQVMQKPWIDVSLFTDNSARQRSSASFRGRAFTMDEMLYTQNADGSSAASFVDGGALTLKTLAVGTSYGSMVNTRSFLDVDIWMMNLSLEDRALPISAYFDGTVTATGGSQQRGSVYAEVGLFATRQGSGTSTGFSQSSIYVRTPTRGFDSTASSLSGSILLKPGLSHFTLTLSMGIDVSGQWEANFSNTTNMFIGAAPDVQVLLPAEVGSKQYIPKWAGGSGPIGTTTPEPGTIALLGSGLALVGVVARRRRAA